MNDSLHKATLVLEHTYSASVERVFAEFADPAARASWSTPGNDSLVYDEADFREGGQDVFRCGAPGNLRFRGVTVYHAIVPNRCVISSETLTESGERRAVSLNTLEFEPTSGGTKLTMTIQIVSFVGSGMVAGYESGNRGALKGLAKHLAKTH